MLLQRNYVFCTPWIMLLPFQVLSVYAEFGKLRAIPLTHWMQISAARRKARISSLAPVKDLELIAVVRREERGDVAQALG